MIIIIITFTMISSSNSSSSSSSSISSSSDSSSSSNSSSSSSNSSSSSSSSGSSSSSSMFVIRMMLISSSSLWQLQPITSRKDSLACAHPMMSGTEITRHKLIHIHQHMFTVSNQQQVYLILNNWCICTNLSCGEMHLSNLDILDV